MFNLQSGREVAMPGAYDEMSDRLYITYRGGTTAQRRARDLLRAAMEAEGFTVYDVEWRHYDDQDWREYSILGYRLRTD